jgi:hypothetical protein
MDLETKDKMLIEVQNQLAEVKKKLETKEKL